MNHAMQPLESNSVEGFPRIDRYFPDCWCATIEAVSKFLFGVNDFGRIYGRHSFRYRRPPGPIRFRADGVQLDLEIHREPMPNLAELVEDIYGIHTELHRTDDLESYWASCLRSIDRHVPVITDFDLKFMKARREYGKVDTPHVIVLYGYHLREQQVLAADQMLGTTHLDWPDFERCFEHKVATEDGMRSWQICRTGRRERQLERSEVLAQIETNICNLSSSDASLGLTALARFTTDLREYLQSESFQGRPFAVPGLWVFSHERHIERKWLNAVRHLCPGQALSFLEDFDALLAKLFNRWLNADYLSEKCLAADNGKLLKNLPDYLAEILEDERRALQSWTTLHALVTRG